MSSSSPGTSPAEPGAAPNRVLDRGDVVNLLGRFRRRLEENGRKITVAQNRLIMKRLEDQGVWDTEISTTPRDQLGSIAGVVADFVPLDPREVEARLRACRSA